MRLIRRTPATVLILLAAAACVVVGAAATPLMAGTATNGRIPAIESPAEFNAALLAFLESALRRSS